MLWSSLLLSTSYLSASALGASLNLPRSTAYNSSNSSNSTRPNIVFILTDDQDLHLNSLDYLPYVKKHLTEQGTYFGRHYCTIAICCPSRVNLWSAKYPHNTNVTDVAPPYGGYPKVVSQKIMDNWLFTWMRDAGYSNYYVGKLFNHHNITNYNKPFPKGFTENDFLLDPYTYQYYNSSFQRNKAAPVNYAGLYQTDLVANKTYGFLDTAVTAGEPFFLVVAPTSPHANVDGATSTFSEPLPAKRHEHLFSNVTVPRTPHFNPENPSGANWVKKLPRQNQTNVDYNDHFYRQRLRALQSFDEMVDGIFKRLESYGILDNTYVIYSTDNGFHIGQHRLQPGKECGYEEDINIPLVIRGPGVPKNKTVDFVTSHTDMAPTILDMVNAAARPDIDGLAIPLTEQGMEAAESSRQEHVNVEYWGYGIDEGIYGKDDYSTFAAYNTYKTLRLSGKDYNLYYSVWCNNEHELYDMKADPYQMNNLYLVNGTYGSTDIYGVSTTRLINRLDALLFVLKSCKEDSCRDPWSTLHPRGNVQSLKDALNARYDHYYASLPKVEYERCELGYILDAEGPQWSNKDAYVGSNSARWHDWV